LNEAYDPGSQLPGKPLAMALLPDGRHLIGASVGWNEVRLFCFDSRGNLDPSFGNAAAFEHRYDEHLELLPLADGRVLVGGFFQRVGTEHRSGIARLLPDGRLDGAFNAEQVIDAFTRVTALALDAGTGYLVATRADSGGTGFLRLQADGKPGKTTPLTKEERQRLEFSVLTDGHRVQVADGGEVRLFSRSGVLQRIWRRVGAFAPLGSHHYAALTPDGKLLVTGYGADLADGRANFGLVRLVPIQSVRPFKRGSKRTPQPFLTTKAGVDRGFAMPGGVSVPNLGIEQVVCESTGSLLVRGSFNMVNGIRKSGLARIFSDGTLDRSFELAGIGSLGRFTMLPDGTILVEGSIFEDPYGPGVGCLFRYDTAGRQDPTFSPRLDNERVLDFATTSSGVLVYLRAQGQWSDGNPTLLRRLNTVTGTWDPGFAVVVGGFARFPGYLEHVLANEADNTAYVLGDFAYLNSTACDRAGRILSDGTPDPSYQLDSPHQFYYRVLGAQIGSGGRLILVTEDNDGSGRGYIHSHANDGSIISSSAVTLPAGVRRALPLPEEAWLLLAQPQAEVSFHLLQADGLLSPSRTIILPSPLEKTAVLVDSNQRILIGAPEVSTPQGLWSGLVRLD
jgi:uncharacterized delta-60 repeat protein